jgi:hypothetical protein
MRGCGARSHGNRQRRVIDAAKGKEKLARAQESTTRQTIPGALRAYPPVRSKRTSQAVLHRWRHPRDRCRTVLPSCSGPRVSHPVHRRRTHRPGVAGCRTHARLDRGSPSTGRSLGTGTLERSIRPSENCVGFLDRRSRGRSRLPGVPVGVPELGGVVKEAEDQVVGGSPDACLRSKAISELESSPGEKS